MIFIWGIFLSQYSEWTILCMEKKLRPKIHNFTCTDFFFFRKKNNLLYQICRHTFLYLITNNTIYSSSFIFFQFFIKTKWLTMINAQFAGHNFAMDQLFQIFSHHLLLKSHSGHSSCSYLALFSLSKPGCLPFSSTFFLFPGQDTSTNLIRWSLLALFAFCCIFTCVVNRLSIIKQKWFHWKEFRHVFTIGQWIVWHFIVCISNQCILAPVFIYVR